MGKNLLGCDTIWFVITDVSEDHIVYIFREERISELGTMLAVTSNRSML
jgi:hypothetical protein